jgi:hypothetical protein
MTRARTVTIELIPPSVDRAAQGMPLDATWAAVVRRPDGTGAVAIPDGDERTEHPEDYARRIGEQFKARYRKPPDWLIFDLAEDGTWVLVDLRRCLACGQIKGLPMCCDDPITKREMMLLGHNAPFVIRKNAAAGVQ